MKTLIALFATAACALADLHVRVELDGGVARDVLTFDRSGNTARVRHGSATGQGDPETWTEAKLDEAAAKGFEDVLAKEDVWALASDAAEAPKDGKVTSWAAACRVTAETDEGKRASAVKRPFSTLEDSAFGRIARALLALARPAPPGRGIEFSFRMAIMDNGYTLGLALDGPRARAWVRPHDPAGAPVEPISRDLPPEDFEVAWKALEEAGPWTLGDVSGASLDGDRYDVRVWKDGVEHRFRLYRPQELGPQPQKNVMAAALAAPGMKTFRDSTIERYRESQLRTRIERLYGDWSGADLQVRQDAERALVEIGKVGIAAFRELLAAEKSKDLKLRGEALIERIERSGR